MKLRQTPTEKASTLLLRQSHAGALFTDSLTRITNALASWRVMALGLLAVNAILVLGLLYQSSQVRIIPYIDVVDPQNRVLWSGPAGSYRPDDLWVADSLQRWLTDLRSRPGALKKPGNLEILNQRWKDAYALTDQEAKHALAVYFDEENPLKYQPEVEVSLTIESLSRYPQRPEDDPKTRVYHVEWQETWTGSLRKQPRFTGDFWTELRPDARKGQTELMTQRGVERGRPGLYIIKFRWDQKLGGAK